MTARDPERFLRALDSDPAARIRSPAVTHAEVQDRRASTEEAQLLARLRAGDEPAFATLVDRHYGTMLAVAQGYVRSRAVAEEVVQEAWLGVLQGLDRFEGRSSLKTWILRITVNIAKTRGAREARSVPFAAFAPEGEEPAVEPERFRGAQDGFPGHWRAYPGDWRGLPEDALAARDAVQVVLAAIDALPAAQRTVIAMRDIHGCDAEEVCAALDVSHGNQRVLLHRARSRVRSALEAHIDG
jgi:RNA polymerase sigma-70 factor (ECF subfamily)